MIRIILVISLFVNISFTQPVELVESFSFDMTQSNFYESITLQNGVEYVLKVSGTYSYGSSNLVDAAYRIEGIGGIPIVPPEPFVEHDAIFAWDDGDDIFPETLNWDDYSHRPTPDEYGSDNVYYYYFTSDGTTEKFLWDDGGGYGDNSGGLSFEIWRIASVLKVPSEFSTIQEAIDTAVDGDTILVADGTYNVNNLNISNKLINILSENGKNTTFIDGQSTNRIMTINNPETDTLKINGFTIQNGDALTNVGYVLKVEQGIVIFDNLIFDNNGQNTGNQLFQGSGVNKTFFKNCIIRNNSAENYAGVSHSTVENCLVYGNSGSNNTAPVYLCYSVNSTICDNGGGVLGNPWTTGGISGGTATNCIVWGNQGYNGQQIYSATSVTYSNVQGDYSGTGNINSDPLFVNSISGDYHLQDTSPCIKAATPVGCPITDIEGTKRGNPPDMGAYENISDGDQSLPVSLVSFKATSVNKIVTLEWVTESEIDNLGFIIQRSENNDNSFIELDSYEYNDDLKGAGTTSQRNEYIYKDINVFNGNVYWYRLIDVDINGLKTEHNIVSAIPNNTDIQLENNNDIPTTYKLLQNFPNPFNPSTTISFDIPKTDELIDVNLSIYNVLGEKIITLVDNKFPNGKYSLKWNGKNSEGQVVPAGLYIYILKSKYFVKSNKMLFLK